ncbi:hypothetical protein [Streptomyces sp. Isolate_219]|uniref:hypothetical protein n=1 Tax=Streptomyces sp. Isolate_219 TaxID=2950110 RepID=UPI0021CA569D|nr:hypothetical protein [Streptomyces sp. Isolate_219]MCR8578908.1 hypothetical protein [Streptomyces sp. Isolate_219]
MGDSGDTNTVGTGDGAGGHLAVCAGATLALRGESLHVAWADGGHLALPVTWCRTAEAQQVGEETGAGVQIVLRFAPPRSAGGTDIEGLIAVRLSADRERTLDTHEFLEILRIRAGLKAAYPAPAPREEEAGAEAAGEEENTSGTAASAPGPSSPLRPRMRRAPRSRPDWLVFNAADNAEVLYEDVQRQLSMNGEG